MIEGNFTDVSLPAMLQFLCMEPQKSFRVGVSLDSQRGEIYIRRGWVIAAVYGILEGEDAFCEFMSWREGLFWAEPVTPELEIAKNLSFAFQPNSSFIQDCAYLTKVNAGLNSQITGSILYGSTAWKEAVRDNPLDRESLSVLAWLREGRTTHQAMREFGFDIVKAASILARLLLTRSVDIVRPSLDEAENNAAAASDPKNAVVDELTTGGQEAAAAKLAQEAARALESAASVAQEAFLSKSFRSIPHDSYSLQSDTNPNLPRAQPANVAEGGQLRSSVEARLRAKRPGATSTNLPAYVEPKAKPYELPKQTEDTDASESSVPDSVIYKPVSSPVVPGPAEKSPGPNEAKERVVTTADGWLDDQPPSRSSGLQALLKNALEKSKQIASERLGASDVDTSDALTVLRDGPTVVEARGENAGLPADSAALESASDKGKEVLSFTPPDASTPEPPAALAPLAPAEAPVSVESPTPVESPAFAEASSSPPSRGWTAEAATDATASAHDVPPDDPRYTSRTVALPLVALDIERLLQATFSPTQFGKLALGNPSLDQHRRQTLLDAERGQPLAISLEDRSRSAAAVLSSYRYCLDRGYIDTQDPVIPLTADLLLGRMEIDQYLLQRRRITGDQLRDLIKIARQEGIKLPQLLMRSGFLTPGDIETLDREQKRFAFK